MKDFTLIRWQMVQEQIACRGITNKYLLKIMTEINRHFFINEFLWTQAYNDYPLAIGEGQTLSQPYMVALMTDALSLSGKEKILEVGTGSGYQTAILAKLANKVFSIERFISLSRNAQKVLKRMGIFNINFIIDDGSKGYFTEAPYDGIIVTAGAPEVPKPLLEQLKELGRLVLPVGNRFLQTLYRITYNSGQFIYDDLGNCRFVDLVGKYGW